jgi:iron only hydrogenase large subunit-like protein
MEEKYWYQSMGNLHDVNDFMEIWDSPRAQEVREKVATCPKNCWMIGSASPVIRKYIKKVLPWIVKNKLKSISGRHICGDCCPHYYVGQNPEQGSLSSQ